MLHSEKHFCEVINFLFTRIDHALGYKIGTGKPASMIILMSHL